MSILLNRIILVGVLFVILAVSIQSCSEDPAPPNDSVIVDELDTLVVKDSESMIRIKNGRLDSAELEIYHQVLNKYSQVPYYTKVDNEILFYVSKGAATNTAYEFNGEYPKGKDLKFGIVNSDLEVILPIEFDKIFNPDLTSVGYIEIEKNNKIGLFNYTNNQRVSCEYDVLFPSEKDELAIGRIGDDYFSVFETKKVQIQDQQDIPAYKSILNTYSFDIFDSTLTYIHETTDLDEDFIEFASGAIVTPSFLSVLDLIPEIQTGIITSTDEYFGMVQSKVEVSSSRSLKDKVTTFISDFYEEGVDGRGYQTNEKKITVIDQQNNVLSQKTFGDEYVNNEYYFCEDNQSRINFINDSTIEVKTFTSKFTDFTFYRSMQVYDYYRIVQNGNIVQIDSDRFFDFTKFIKIDESYIIGCYSKDDDSDDEYESEIHVMDHLDLNDLEIMRNEIYADYGLIFQKERLRKYFYNTTWYAALYNNVDAYLTEIDKHNIEVIQRIEKKLHAKEKELVNKRKVHFSVPG